MPFSPVHAVRDSSVTAPAIRSSGTGAGTTGGKLHMFGSKFPLTSGTEDQESDKFLFYPERHRQIRVPFKLDEWGQMLEYGHPDLKGSG